MDTSANTMSRSAVRAGRRVMQAPALPGFIWFARKFCGRFGTRPYYAAVGVYVLVAPEREDVNIVDRGVICGWCWHRTILPQSFFQNDSSLSEGADCGGARVSGGHLCEYNEQKRCPSRQARTASPRPTRIHLFCTKILRAIRESPLRCRSKFFRNLTGR